MIRKISGKHARQYLQLERLFLVIELLAPLRSGATVDELQKDVSEILGKGYCARTIYRDLSALEMFGIVVSDARSTRWRIRNGSVRTAIAREVAEMRSSIRESRSTDPESDTLKAAEAASLVTSHGWTFAAAIELTGADPRLARKQMQRPQSLPDVPTPAEIADRCHQIRLMKGHGSEGDLR